MSYEDLRLEYKFDGLAPPARHTLITINGFMGSMWDGYGAACAAGLGDELFYHQPVYYDSTKLPMEPAIQQGLTEACKQIELHPGTFALGVYSEGAIIGSLVLEELRTGRLTHRYDDCIAAVAFGNPTREKGSRPPGCPDPGGRGIAEQRIENTPEWWYDYSDSSDMYCCTPDDKSGEYITSIYQAVARMKLTGRNALVEQMLQLLTFAPTEIFGVGKAIIKAISFYGGGTPGHIHYHDRNIIPGVTYLQHAINHLNKRGHEITPREA
jgi:hypothetical protein